MMTFNPDEPGYAEGEIVKLTRSGFKDSYQNFSKRPCFRETILWSLNVGFFAGLGRFMTSSSVSKSIVFGTCSLSASLAIIYTACRIKQIRDKFQVYQLEPVLQGYAEIYGTDKDKILKEDLSSKSEFTVKSM